MSNPMNRKSFIRRVAAAGVFPLVGLPVSSSQAATVPPTPVADPGGLTVLQTYPRSTILKGLEWVGPAQKYPGSGSDMHWHAWAEDALYCVDGDGKNFGGQENFAHLLRVTGVPPNHIVEHVSYFPDYKHGSDLRTRYVCGALAVGSRLYVAAYNYNNSRIGERAPSNNDPRRPTGYNMGDGWYYDSISQHGGVESLMYSDDKGVTWNNLPTLETPYFLGARFAALAFVGFGPGYTEVPESLGDYVYAISNDENWESGNSVFLARVPRDKVLDRAAWEFFAGSYEFEGWSPDEDQARPVLSVPGKVGHPTMTYNKGLKRFLLAYGCDSVPHSFALPREVALKTWHRRRELYLFEGPTPWGPWALVHHDPSWEGQHVAYLPQIPGNWLGSDGLSGTMLFSGDYSYFFKQPEGYESMYAFMTRQFRLIPA